MALWDCRRRWSGPKMCTGLLAWGCHGNLKLAYELISGFASEAVEKENKSLERTNSRLFLPVSSCVLRDKMREITKDEVAQHNKPDDLWIIFEDKVCDLSSYYPSHPGGAALLRQAGKDATIFIKPVTAHNFSWNFIEKKLNECCIGTLKKRF